MGTWITPDGQPEPLSNGMLTMEAVAYSDVAEREVPVVWDITLPEKELSIRTSALFPDSWMGTRIPYWEGPVAITGSHTGEGYLEMSGY